MGLRPEGQRLRYACSISCCVCVSRRSASSGQTVAHLISAGYARLGHTIQPTNSVTNVYCAKFREITAHLPEWHIADDFCESRRAEHFFVASPTSRDLLICAKDLLVEASSGPLEAQSHPPHQCPKATGDFRITATWVYKSARSSSSSGGCWSLWIEPCHGRTKRACDPVYGAMAVSQRRGRCLSTLTKRIKSLKTALHQELG